MVSAKHARVVPSGMKIRKLQKDDAAEWRKLRERMLRDHPEAFGEHIDDFLQRPMVEVALRVVEGNVFGAFVDEKLVGSAGWHDEKGRKRAHIGVIWGVYVAPEARSRGIGGVLLGTMLVEIRNSGRTLAELSVAEPNTVARDLYESAGFRVWGREEDALRVDGRSITEIHMSRGL
jgi:predicted GNAT family acetyltransferase